MPKGKKNELETGANATGSGEKGQAQVEQVKPLCAANQFT